MAEDPRPGSLSLPPQPVSVTLQPPTQLPATTSKKTRPVKAVGQASKERFSNEDLDSILVWLEHRPNYDKIYGTSGKTAVGLPLQSASKGYAELASHVNKNSKGRWNLAGKQVRERFNRYKKNTYLVARLAINATGFGITDEDRANGIHRLEHKRESMCHGFDRMEALFGEKPNVEPLVEAEFYGEDEEEVEEDEIEEQERSLDAEEAELLDEEEEEEEVGLPRVRIRQIVEEEDDDSETDLGSSFDSPIIPAADENNHNRKRRSSNSTDTSTTSNSRKPRLRLDTGPSQTKGSYAAALTEMMKDKNKGNT